MENNFSDLYKEWIWYIKEKNLYGRWLRDSAMLAQNLFHYRGIYFDVRRCDTNPLIPNSKELRCLGTLRIRPTEDSFRYDMGIIKENAKFMINGCGFDKFWPSLCTKFFKERKTHDLSRSLSRKYTRMNTYNGNNKKKVKNKTLAEQQEKWYKKIERNKRVFGSYNIF